MAEPYTNNLDHLDEEAAWLDLVIRFAVLRTDPAGSDGGGLYVSDRAVKNLLENASRVDSITQDEFELVGLIDAKREDIATRVSASLEQGVSLRLPRLARLLSLSPFETDVITVCLAPEMDVKYERLYAYLQDDATRRVPSVNLVLDLLCRNREERAAARGAFLPSGSLFRYSLLRFADPDESPRSLLSRGLKLDEGMAHFILGDMEVDPRIAPYCRLIAPRKPSSGRQENCLMEPFRRYLAEPASHQWIAQFTGPDRACQEETAEFLCAENGVPLLVVDMEALIEDDIPVSRLIPLVFREAALKSAAVYLDSADALTAETNRGSSGLRHLEKAMEEMGWITFLAGRIKSDLCDVLKRQMFFTVDFPLPAYPERKRIWHEYAGNGRTASNDPLLADLAARYRFTRREIRNAIGLARTGCMLRSGPEAAITRADLETACRSESNPRLVSFAGKIRTCYAWEDLVLPAAQKDQLGEIVEHIRNHEAVYSEWGFSRKHSLGRGVNILFSGPSGTGKTMAAGIMASQLGLDCYKIDLSTVVSKYIGETEKNLNRIFAEAETSNAVLFFDEADALFGRRTEVKDSHDRYANIEVNYLLQKMEEHEGVVILATNLSKNVDDAFLRRVHFSVPFPFPEKEERLLVWQRIFPEETPLADDLDRDFLARRLKITGGSIKNIATGAAFLAKSDNSGITMRHVILSARRELQKMGKLCTRAEFGEYYDIIT